jgi:hypothetical protein
MFPDRRWSPADAPAAYIAHPSRERRGDTRPIRQAAFKIIGYAVIGYAVIGRAVHRVRRLMRRRATPDGSPAIYRRGAMPCARLPRRGATPEVIPRRTVRHSPSCRRNATHSVFNVHVYPALKRRATIATSLRDPWPPPVFAARAGTAI